MGAREAYNLEALVFVPLIELHKLHVVAFGEGSSRGDICDQGALLSFHEVAQDVLVLVNVFYHNGPQLANDAVL